MVRGSVLRPRVVSMSVFPGEFGSLHSKYRYLEGGRYEKRSHHFPVTYNYNALQNKLLVHVIVFAIVEEEKTQHCPNRPR